MSSQSYSSAGRGSRTSALLSLDRLMTGSLIHIVYWCGLGVIVLMSFGAIGAAVGIFLREPGVMGLVAAVPTLIGGLLVLIILTLLWRSFCEFYVIIFRISEDLQVLRRGLETDSPNAAVAPAKITTPTDLR